MKSKLDENKDFFESDKTKFVTELSCPTRFITLFSSCILYIFIKLSKPPLTTQSL